MKKKKRPGKNEKKAHPSFPCPHCGAGVPAGAAACPECGSDETTGWAGGAAEWGAEIPSGYGDDEDFDYDDFLEREFGKGSGGSRGPGGGGTRDRAGGRNGPPGPAITIPAWVIALVLCILLAAAAAVFGIFR